MAKYRVLTREELDELRKEFIEFLVVNGIEAKDWEALLKNEPKESERIIDLFSDVVFEGVMRKVKFLELRTKNDIKVFQCLPDQLIMVGMTCTDQNADFTDSKFLHSAMLTPPSGLKVYTTSKKYTQVRELELFGMIEKGCLITDGALFKSISLALPSA